VRRHRLWEVFLCEKLYFEWDEVHEIAEQMEHVASDELIERLNAFLGYPKFDPHGDPIPDENGQCQKREQFALSDTPLGKRTTMVGVNEHSSLFLRFLKQMGLYIGCKIQLINRFDFDKSVQILRVPSSNS
jgi:Mn-dependent transcriptional regulator